MVEVARARIRVWGVVQGVGYRYFVRRTAVALGLRGYVKNLPDGSVEVLAEGERISVDGLMHEMKAGARYASVDKIDIRWEEPGYDLDGFEYAF